MVKVEFHDDNDGSVVSVKVPTGTKLTEGKLRDTSTLLDRSFSSLLQFHRLPENLDLGFHLLLLFLSVLR